MDASRPFETPVTGSRLSKHRLELLWGAFVLASVAVMFAVPNTHWQTVPFHLIWISLAMIYGLRVWSSRATMITLAAIMAVTLVPLVVKRTPVHELTEIPLMAMLFLAMVWHAQRRKRALDALELSVAREHEFLRDASHQLRTPITIARGHAELALRRAADESVAADTAVVLDELDNLQRLSDRLLLLANSDQPTLLDTRVRDLGSIAARAAERWRTSDRTVTATAGTPVLAEVDATQLEEALDAIVENAIDHTDRGGTIEIAARREGPHAVIAVIDDGRGIAPEHLPHVFDRFYGTNDGPRRSTGLGLSIARSVAEAHGGTATVASEVGAGTRVTLALPAIDPATPGAASDDLRDLHAARE